MTRMICRLILVASLVLLLNVILSVSAATATADEVTWSATGSMISVRSSDPQTATLLADGRVLVAGGCGVYDFVEGGCLTLLASAEVYNPATGTWSTTGSMTAARTNHAATRLLDGRVLVAGGEDTPQSAELYDPTTGTWSVTGGGFPPLIGTVGRLTLLLDGRVLLVDNLAGLVFGDALYDPTTGTWSATGSPASPIITSATRLLDGRVLGTGQDEKGRPSAELYDPTTGTWSATGGSSGFVTAATLLMDGRVLAISYGGTSAELYNPTTGTWSATGNRPFVGGDSLIFFGGGALTLLRDGTVLLAGVGPNGTNAELYDPTTGTWSATGTMEASPGGIATTTGLLDGRVLVAGYGSNGTSAEIFTCNHFSNCVVRSPLVAAVLPASRSVAAGTPATAFATIINTGTSTATGCQITPGDATLNYEQIGSLFASFAFQTTNPATNAVTGTINTPVDIPANAAQSFVVAFTPPDVIPPSDVALNFFCDNAIAAPVVPGVNTLLLSASTTPAPDIVALAASADPGIVDIPGANGTGVFAVATVNVGASSAITLTADTGGVSLPVSILLCQTNPQTSACLPPGPAASVTTVINAGGTPTFGVFVTGTGVVPFDPANNRIFFRAKDAGGVTRGSTSEAVRTQ
jgi:hypothetical protein